MIKIDRHLYLGYNVEGDHGAPHGQFGYMSNPTLGQLAHFPGPNDVNGAFNPFVYQPPSTTYLNDPFLYATHTQQAEEPYPQHQILAAPSQSTYQQQLRELNPNHLENYEERDAAIPKRKRPEKIRTAKPITMEELEHDNSRFARVVKALLSIQDPTKRTVPEIAKAVQDMYPGRYADFEAVKVCYCEANAPSNVNLLTNFYSVWSMMSSRSIRRSTITAGDRRTI